MSTEISLALIVTLAVHFAGTVWWASRMHAHVEHLVKSVDTLVKQGASHNLLLTEHATRLAVLEAQQREKNDG